MRPDWVRRILARYGQAVRIETPAGRITARAFLQPVTERSEKVPGVMTGIGWIDERLWLYLGEAAVNAGDTVTWNGARFRVRSSRPYYMGEALIYWWASLEQEREAAE